MELKNRDGYELISSDELNILKKFMVALHKFKTTYFVFNRQLNTLLKIGEQIQGKEFENGNNRIHSKEHLPSGEPVGSDNPCSSCHCGIHPID